MVGACELSLDNLSMKPFSLLCRWDSSSIDQGFKGLGYALHLVVVFLNTFTSVFGEKRRSRIHDPMALDLRLGSNPDVPPIDVAGLPIGEGTVLFGEPIGAVKALVSRPEVADALGAFMGPRQSGLALINAPDRNGDVRVQMTMGEIRVASNKKIPPDQWRVPADLLVVLAQAVEQADAEEIGE